MDTLEGLCFDKLPRHLVETMIVDKLSLPDLIRFGAICRSGRSMAAKIQPVRHPLPLLMISRDKETQIGSFFSLSDSKIYNIKLTKEACESFCCGSSSQGYLIMANAKSNFLYNPFTQNTITLPQQYVPQEDIRAARCIDTDYRCYFAKAIICTPSPNKLPYILAIGSNPRVIEMCRPHDSEWLLFGVDKEKDNDSGTEDEEELRYPSDYEENVLEEDEFLDENEENQWFFTDLLLYKGMLYGLTRAKKLVTFVLHGSSNSLEYKVLNMLPQGRPMIKNIIYGRYLVELCGELMMVHRIRSVVNNGNGGKYSTIKFSVYRLNQRNDLFEWVEVQSLGDQMLFLGRNSSISVSTNGIPGLKGNCIYFIDDVWPFFEYGINSSPSCLDNGIFYLDDGRFEKFYTPNSSHLIKFQPFWITPNVIQDVKL